MLIITRLNYAFSSTKLLYFHEFLSLTFLFYISLTSDIKMHKSTFLRTFRLKMCILILFYLYNTQKNSTFAAVFLNETLTA